MKYLVIGSGGREHALLRKMKQDYGAGGEFHCAPGNAGIREIAACHPVSATDIENLTALVESIRPDLTVVGPENALDLGLVDQLSKLGFRVFGPSAAATMIESSKFFAKQIMEKAQVPTAGYQAFRDPVAAGQHLHNNTFSWPMVIKTNGLALGKGVRVCHSFADARDFISILVKEYPNDAVLLEEYLEGPECSVMAISDGQNFVSFPPIRDHKPVFDGNLGPNTGGMGAFYPIPEDTPEFRKTVDQMIIAPVLRQMKKNGTPFVGCLYAGLKITPEGIKVVEFNARFGDPEIEVALPMLNESILDLTERAVDGTLTTRPARWLDTVCEAACVDVVIASGGYPGTYKKGLEITGIEKALSTGAIIFHAGTMLTDQGELVTNGGRVLNVVGRGNTLISAAEQAYRAVSRINFEKMHYRTDIGMPIR